MLAIRLFREKACLTQEKLASSIGVTQAAVAMWEAGDRNPDIVMLKKLASVFGCTADELLEPIQIDLAAKKTAAPECEPDTAEKKKNCISGITITLHGDAEQ